MEKRYLVVKVVGGTIINLTDNDNGHSWETEEKAISWIDSEEKGTYTILPIYRVK